MLMACLPLAAFSQLPKTGKKYPTLLWEITGKGLSKPSYLFGTMHVSDKMVFNLDDSFYNALKSAGTVALELDPGIWQQHYAKEDQQQGYSNYALFGGNREGNGGLKMNFFSIDPYVDEIAKAINMQPTNINSFLYRNSSNSKIDYEENTYLDLHLYQSAMKLGKRIAGLENIDTSDHIEEKAMKAGRKDKKRPQFDYDAIPNLNTALQDAYRTGDLDLLDSLQDISSLPSFRKVFLFDRNVIQANSIDTILKRGETVFAAVGAAHLPGKYGVIEELRRKGYKMRPMTMRASNSSEKDRIDKLVSPISFAPVYTPDSVVQVDLPGQWFRMGRNRILQHADMANGSYYTLFRQRTSADFWNESPTQVMRKVDSLLYEKVAGKIQKKEKITVNGYPGVDVTSLTRRGDVQRYRIVATPFELVVLKMSGPADYVQRTGDANRFFNSLSIQPLEREKLTTAFQPAWGGFAVAFPHQPWVGTKNTTAGKLIPFHYAATDSASGTCYDLLREVLPRNAYLEEDTFELNLMQDSYMSSKMVQKELSHQFVKVNGYPALKSTFKLENGQHSQALFVIQGANYYSLVAQRKLPFKDTDPVLASFAIKPFVYPAAKPDSSKLMGYTVLTNVAIPQNKKEKDLLETIGSELGEDDDMASALDMLRNYNNIQIKNDTIGELIMLGSTILPPFTYLKDSSEFFGRLDEQNKALVLKSKKLAQQKGWLVTERFYTDTNSSRMMRYKSFYKDGMVFGLSQYTDTLTPPSDFANNFFTSFTPSDTLKGIDPFTPKGSLFVKDYSSKDSVSRKKALRTLSNIVFTKEELPFLSKITDTLSWKAKDYLNLKQKLYTAVGTIKEDAATNWLKEQYAKVQDTAVFQQALLDALLDQQSLASFKTFEELVTGNPPILDGASQGGNSRDMRSLARMLSSNSIDMDFVERYSGRGQWNQLYDSLSLTAKIMPGLMNLLVLDDYKKDIESLMVAMADSNYLTKEMMQPYYTKYLLETKQELKKLLAKESAAGIARKSKEADGDDDVIESYGGYNRYGNRQDEILEKMALLLPFYEAQQPVRDLIHQAFTLEDKDIKLGLLELVQKKFPKAVPDTMTSFFAKDIETRSTLYNNLYDDSLVQNFPKAFATPTLIADSRLRKTLEQKPDSFVLVGKRPATLQGKKGEVFVYKYRNKKENSLWRWAVIGMVPTDTLITNRADLQLDIADAGFLKTGKPEKEEVDRLVKEALNGTRPCAESFYRQNDRYNNRYDYTHLQYED